MDCPRTTSPGSSDSCRKPHGSARSDWTSPARESQTRKQQLRVFDAILAEPQLRTRPVTVHSRGAERETITRLAQAQVTATLHWYTGPLAAADDALVAGLRFSINPAMTRSPKAVALLRQLPAERVLLETDGPFARWGNRPASPTDLPETLQHLARLWSTSVDQARTTVAANQQRLLAAAAGRTDQTY
ncbi:MAG: TatD family hydrolase [Pseudonocardiaceae bacterium]